MQKHSILIMFHCDEHTEFAIKTLKSVFIRAASKAGYSDNQIFLSYNRITSNSYRIISCNYTDPPKTLDNFLKSNNIKVVLAFDLGYPCKILKILKKSGVKKIVSYWGASMSSINSGLKLLLKKIEYILRINIPDHFIFESQAMKLTATHGRGVQESAISVINLGVDTEIFFPEYDNFYYAHQQFSLANDTKIVFYSGHMEERKGVKTIINAAIKLADNNKIDGLHFILCGNKGDEADTYVRMMSNSIANKHVTFAGYRHDIPELMRSSYIGIIASTGWDSFTMSSVEMMASGLPLIVSNLQGLSETIDEGINGFKVTPGDYNDLSEKIHLLHLDTNLAKSFSSGSRTRALKLFSIKDQISKISQLLKIES